MGIRESIAILSTLLVQVHDADLKAEIQAALLNAQGEALDLQQRVPELQAENEQLRAELRERDELAEIADDLYYARHAYWRRSETATSAYCPTCWEDKRKLFRLMRTGTDDGLCQKCKSVHNDVYNGPRPNEGDSATPKPPPEEGMTFLPT